MLKLSKIKRKKIRNLLKLKKIIMLKLNPIMLKIKKIKNQFKVTIIIIKLPKVMKIKKKKIRNLLKLNN